MKAAFTICANNYLAAARVLKESFSAQHPDFPFFIVLVDRPDPAIDYNDFSKENIVFIEDIVTLDVNLLSLKFNIAELCTTLKPFVFQYFFKTYNQIVYLDPDIKIYAPLTACWDALQLHSFVLTPHLMNPVDDGKIPSDFFTLRTGVFNLGFIGLSMAESTLAFLKWWGERLLVYGYNDWNNGMFYDQIWANYIPVMFDNYYIIKHYGYNVANWNWHERLLEKKDNSWMVNNKYPLVFFHFSSYQYKHPNILCKYNTRYSRDSRPDLVPVFDDYHQQLAMAGADKAANIKAYFHQQNLHHNWENRASERTLRKKIKRRLIKYLEKYL